MKRLVIIFIVVCLVFGFSFQKSNPFLGFWIYEDTESEDSMVLIFEDSSLSYYVTIFGVGPELLGKDNYYYTNSYLISELENRIDTSIYIFQGDSNLLLINLSYSDTLKLKKAKP